jgi:Icc-related predicted phosphoesterase
MPLWFFASDLHGSEPRYARLFAQIEAERPEAVLLGGDLLPAASPVPVSFDPNRVDFVDDFLFARLHDLRARLGRAYPRVLLILGNDDPRTTEAVILAAAVHKVWDYAHERRVTVGDMDVYGYGCIPPSPFLWKDWERYDVSRYVDPGCVSPEEGYRSIQVSAHEARTRTIDDDLARLTAGRDMTHAVFLFHAPPYGTALDRAALDDRFVEHVPLDVHIGSIAIRRLIEKAQPSVTLHGHVHESARLTGTWREKIGRTWCFTAAHDGPGLALVRFDPNAPESATRELS